ncbi:hypothetical protein GCM10025864_00890 [Luteimicrobium album]|uniref:Uncharacterized protein n=1 Tax=Luteimicrobium album TaxID=1054550 RepID=A0ABQ6HUX7_9MICO|nr:hypothetical protein [Luteimicrobium album]GMA22330.1 hypothetical protein GCM10025864_00890 [Luteimicrobium album]
MIARDPGAAERHALALAESPLQLLMTVEAVDAGHVRGPVAVHARRGVPGLEDAVRAFGTLPLPPTVDLEVRGRVRSTSAGLGATTLVLGDAFSGRAQALLAARDRWTGAAGAACRVVVVDDGLATAHLARVLASPDRRPLVRLGTPPTPRRDALGLAARDGLLRRAELGRLRLVTAFEPPHDVRDALERAGVRIARARLQWAVRVAPAVAGRIGEPVVVVGSALVVDGLLRREPYLAWVRAQAQHGRVRYLPHRREHAGVLAHVAAIPGVVVDRAGLPIELRLAGLRPPQRVAALPTSAIALLPATLAPGCGSTRRSPRPAGGRPASTTTCASTS